MPKPRLDHFERNALVIPECPGPMTKKMPAQLTSHLRLDLCQAVTESALFIERVSAIDLKLRPRCAPTVPQVEPSVRESPGSRVRQFLGQAL
jgi:hypothetical protein